MYSVHCTAILLDIALIYVFFYLLIVTYACTKYVVETIQDFLIKLGIKPLMHLLEISTFSLNNVIVRLTKIMNRADKNWAHF